MLVIEKEDFATDEEVADDTTFFVVDFIRWLKFQVSCDNYFVQI